MYFYGGNIQYMDPRLCSSYLRQSLRQEIRAIVVYLAQCWTRPNWQSHVGGSSGLGNATGVNLIKYPGLTRALEKPVLRATFPHKTMSKGVSVHILVITLFIQTNCLNQ